VESENRQLGCWGFNDHLSFALGLGGECIDERSEELVWKAKTDN